MTRLRIRELEESQIETERKFQARLHEEKSYHQDHLNKLNAKLNEEKDNYLIQYGEFYGSLILIGILIIFFRISGLENQITSCKEESFKYLKELTDLSKVGKFYMG